MKPIVTEVLDACFRAKYDTEKYSDSGYPEKLSCRSGSSGRATVCYTNEGLEVTIEGQTSIWQNGFTPAQLDRAYGHLDMTPA